MVASNMSCGSLCGAEPPTQQPPACAVCNRWRDLMIIITLSHKATEHLLHKLCAGRISRVYKQNCKPLSDNSQFLRSDIIVFHSLAAGRMLRRNLHLVRTFKARSLRDSHGALPGADYSAYLIIYRRDGDICSIIWCFFQDTNLSWAKTTSVLNEHSWATPYQLRHLGILGMLPRSAQGLQRVKPLDRAAF